MSKVLQQLTAGIFTLVICIVSAQSQTLEKNSQGRIELDSFTTPSIYGYTLPSLVTTGWSYAILFTAVLAGHLLLADRALARAHPAQFAHETRWIGIASVGAGFGAAYLLPPANDFILAIVTAFLGGSLLMTTFREELPAASRTRIPWFLLGLVVMSGLLIISLAVGKHR